MKKKSCWGCGSTSVIGWGKRNGHQRYKCKDRGLLFQWDNKAVSESNQFIWFIKWVNGQARLQNSFYGDENEQQEHKPLFKKYLSQAPVIPKLPYMIIAPQNKN